MATIKLEDAGEAKETGRVEAFSDGVFAIAVTLLILEIRTPARHDIGSDGELWHDLRGLWPAYLAYVISFATILVTWINHHAIMRLVGRTDHIFLLLNGLLLSLITAVNFPTSLIAEYIGHPGEQAAAVADSGVLVLMAFAFNLLWRYTIWDRRLPVASADPAQIRAIDRRFRFGPLCYVAAFAMAFVSAKATLISCLLLGILYARKYTGNSGRATQTDEAGTPGG